MVAVPLGPSPVDLTGVRAGDRNQFTVTLRSGSAVIPLTGYDITAQARKKATDQGDPALTAVIEILDEDGGEFLVRWPGDDITTLLAGAAKWTGVWDLQVATGGEDPTTIAAGKFESETDVTRP